MDNDTRTSGDIDVTAGRVNQEAGFSILQFTGNTTNDQTIAHGLTEAPEFMIAIAQDNGNSIPVWHSAAPGAPTNGTGLLNSPSELNMTHVDASDDEFFTISGNGAINSGTVSMYLWHSVPGYSAFGRYQGNSGGGGEDGVFVYLGFKPRLLIIKRSDATDGDWVVLDTTREPSNPNNNWLQFNSQMGESSPANNDVDFLCNGFKVRSGAVALCQNAPYLYMAWAANPFGGSNTVPTTAH